MEYILEANNIEKKYGHFKALNNLSVHIPKGAIYGLIGKNGAGKTTLIRLLCGLQRVTSGEYTIYGISNNSRKIAEARKRIGGIIETPSICSDMTAVDNLKEQYKIIGLPSYNKLDEILKLVGLDNTGKKTAKHFSLGMKRFIIGLGKKVLIANNIGAMWNVIETGTFGEMTVLLSWLGIVSFALQIYFDFSGYSDMAIGLAKIFGMDFDENFNFPYISKSITEFWRRWHITLGKWFKDYIYIPLGGNRKGFIKQIRNILVVWALTGAWHGASWNFVLWGMYFGVILIIEKLFMLKVLEKLPKVFGHIYTILLVLISWVIFAFEDLGQVKNYLATMFGLNGTSFINSEAIYYLKNYLVIIIIGIVCSIPILKLKRKRENKKEIGISIISSIGYVAIVLLSTASLVNNSFNPFLYFRF